MNKKLSPAENALRKKAVAARERDTADYFASSDQLRARVGRREADRLDREADEELNLRVPPAIGTGGELCLPQERMLEHQGIVDTVQDPDGVTVESSFQRLDLAGGANCLALAADMAETIGARNSAEKALAHQLAGLHATSMRMLAKVESEMFKIGQYNGNHAHIETARLANATTRLMRTFQDGLMTMQKLRTGGKQTVVVQHVQVNQAVVAGSVKGGHGGGNAEK
jgi:hypothetical protein